MSFIKSLEDTMNIGQLIEELTQIAESGIGYAAKVFLSHNSSAAPIAITAVTAADAAIGTAGSLAEAAVTPAPDTVEGAATQGTVVVHTDSVAD